MGYSRVETNKLSLTDLDALLKNCRLSLHIPDKPPENALLSAEDILWNIPLRQFLYQGEHVQAFVVAIISNTDQIRWSLAADMKRKDSPVLSKSELAVDAGEIEQFFNGLDLCVTAHPAKTIITAVDSSQVQRKLPGRDAPTQRISNVACDAEFTANIRPSQKSQKSLSLINKTDNGSWCSAYQFTINMPSLQDYQDPSFENAMLFEIHAVCGELGASLQDNESNDATKEVEYGGRLSDRSSHLEELSIRVSSWMSANYDGPKNPGQFEQQKRRNSLGLINTLALSRPYKMIQALVPTRPVLNTSARVVSLPPNFGTDAALIEVRVQSNSTATQPLSLQAVEFITSHWHIQRIGPQPENLPFMLSAYSCYQMVFRASPLTDPVKSEALHGLNLFNIGGLHTDTNTKSTSLASAALNNESTSVSAEKYVERSLDIRFSATITDENGESSGEGFEVVHRVFPLHTLSRDQSHGHENVAVK